MQGELTKRLVNGLRGAGIDFLVYLPETKLSGMIPVMREDPFFRLVPVASEAEGVSIAAGAALTGKQAAVYMEGTGVYVSTYNLFTVGERFGVPMLLLVSYVGSFGDRGDNYLYARYGAKMTGLLNALGIEYQVLEDERDVEEKIKGAVRKMHSLKLPVALLFTGQFTL